MKLSKIKKICIYKEECSIIQGYYVTSKMWQLQGLFTSKLTLYTAWLPVGDPFISTDNLKC